MPLNPENNPYSDGQLTEPTLKKLSREYPPALDNGDVRALALLYRVFHGEDIRLFSPEEEAPDNALGQSDESLKTFSSKIYRY